MKLFKRLIPWILLAFAFFILPVMADKDLFGFSQFRLNLFGRYFSLAFVALGIDLIWGYTGLLSLGQGSSSPSVVTPSHAPVAGYQK
ncbi:MAG: hypothetical protein CM15mP116_08320 [Synechococcus sp.]|nr:MAG: hypothetical protein CM15mP116_08320 [Synechococcus sp.]